MFCLGIKLAWPFGKAWVLPKSVFPCDMERNTNENCCGCFNENLYAFETVKNNIKKLITVARENNHEQ